MQVRNSIWRVFGILGLFISLQCNAQSNTTVTFYTWRPVDIAVWEEVNRLNLIPSVRIETKSIVRAYYFDATLLNIQNKNADIFLWQPGASNLKTLIERDYIAPYKQDLSHMNAGALAGALGPDGQYYGVPFAVQMQSIMVNNKLARKLGVDRKPATLKELENHFSIIKSAGITPIFFSVSEGWYVSQLMGEVFTAGLLEESFTQGLIDGTQCFNTPQYTQIFDTYKRWLDAGYVNTNAKSATYYDMFTAVSFGNAVMSIEGGWMTSKAEPYYTMDANYEFAFWPIPGKSGKYSAFGDGTFQVAKNSPNLEAAQKVLQFTATKKFAELFAKFAQQLPAYGSKIDMPPGDLNTMATLVAEKSYSVSPFNSYALNRGEPNYNELFRQAIVKLTQKEITPTKASQFIQDGLNSWNYVGSAKCK
ncbi:extracellular solute-binding protein [Saccharophagus degradans]|uniref:ABC transporter substrate-binding protein n=1 Tax=Saccharophagus degradans TaxID=86304 RepID=UPI001C08C736|nr:extracellular solute-binding protein [Saccharophagus degradans]MBU2986038.1 extracellular solute-binding protein [Saccharophagus degradans]